MSSKNDKTVDVSNNYTFEEAYAETIMDSVVKAIAKRPNYKRMLTEATAVNLVKDIDENGNEKRDTSGNLLFKEVPKHSLSLQYNTFCNVIVKGMVAAMNDLNANKIIVPSLNGKAVVCKSPIQAGIVYENVHATHEENGFIYAVIDFSVTKGCITKEDLIGFEGYRFGDLVLSVVGIPSFKQLVMNASTTVTEMPKELSDYMDTYNPSKVEGILMKSALSGKVLKGKQYTDAVTQYGRLIKSDARAVGIISMAEQKSRTLSLLIENKLKAMYPMDTAEN